MRNFFHDESFNGIVWVQKETRQNFFSSKSDTIISIPLASFIF